MRAHTEGTHGGHGYTYEMIPHADPGFVAWVIKAAEKNPTVRLDKYMGRLAIYFHLHFLLFG